MRKRRGTALLSLLLAALLLCGCVRDAQPLSWTLYRGKQLIEAAAPARSTGRDEGEMLPFGQMEYVRPDPEALHQAIAEVEPALEGGKNVRAVMTLLDRCYDEYYHFYTMYNLANIRACQDMTDPYYAQEYAWCDENFSLVRQLMEQLYALCAHSDMAGTLERRYFWEGFTQDYGGGTEQTLSDESVALMQRQSALLAQYRALTASPTIELDGQELDYNSALAGLSGWARDQAERAYYKKYNGPLSELYIELVKVRQELARSLGFEDYRQMQYRYTFERDYSPEEAEVYLAGIREHLVPVYRAAMARDLYATLRYDELSDSRLHEILGSGARAVGGQVAEAFDFMSRYGLYDIQVDDRKAPMSFQTYLTDYEAPFVFLDPYGDMEDVLGYSHEFGHYVDAYVNYDAYETIDASECFSQGMELLLLSYYGGALSPEETADLERMKLLDVLDTFVQQASFAEFEETVYSMDPEQLSAEFLNDLSLQVAVDYGYYDGYSEFYYSMSWTDIVHFFEMPFYVITYPVANDAAMQLYWLERQEPGAGVEKYLELLPRGQDGMLAMLDAGGLESPFAPGRLEKLAEDLSARLLG